MTLCRGSVSNDHLPLVDLCQEHGPEEDRPDPVAGFLEADVMLFERVGDEEGAAVTQAGCAYPGLPTRRRTRSAGARLRATLVDMLRLLGTSAWDRVLS